ncbi:Cold-shock DNA-binding domain containing protein [Leishmania donovani]|nr:Cold-shock DNA-binding domain containing protein [Leishmania donovani]
MLSNFSCRVLLTLPAALPPLSFTRRSDVVATAALRTGSRMGLSCALTSGLSPRCFSNTPARLSCGAGILHRSKLCLSGFGEPAQGRPHSTNHGAVRLHGTVTAFKHRRGYGFVLAEGIAASAPPLKHTYVALDTHAAAARNDGVPPAREEPCNELHKSFFFTRSALMGGFYVTEGERVSFAVVPVPPRKGINRRVAGDSPSSCKDDGDHAALAAAETAEFSLGSPEGGLEEDSSAVTSDTQSQPHRIAVSLRYYDDKTGKEKPISPLTLYGKIVEWDAAAGVGVIAELDTRRQYHEDAPRFPFSLENVDLALGTELRSGRYVRFCLEPATPAHSGGGEDTAAAATPTSGAEAAADVDEDVELVAQRVIIDSTMERRKGAFGRPLVLADAAPGTMTSESRFSGVVREVKVDHFGFIQDDLSGESIFFHFSNTSSKVKAGDRVTYLLREVEYGKHAGKKACYDVLIDQTSTSRAPGAASDRGASAGAGDAGEHHRKHAAERRSKTARDEDDLDFELL